MAGTVTECSKTKTDLTRPPSFNRLERHLIAKQENEEDPLQIPEVLDDGHACALKRLGTIYIASYFAKLS